MDNTFCRMRQSVTMLCMALIVVGCNGGSDDGNSTSGAKQPPEIATISAQNATFVTGYADSYQVDLSDKVSVSHGQSFALQRVTSLSATPDCQPLSQSAQSFTIAADRSKSCDYQYQVVVTGDSANSASDSAITRVAVSRDASDGDEVDLPAIYSTTMVEQQIDVNVYQQLMQQSGYTLAGGFTLSDVVTLPYSSNVATVDAASHVITYTPPAGFEGVERILFSYHNDTSGEVLLGTLDIAVSSRENQGLVIEDGAEHDKVQIDQQVTIDIEPYVTSLDGDDFQLVRVDALNAATSPVSSAIDNKKFYFETAKFGAHTVSYAVTDHKGAYAMGLMKIPAYDPKNTAQWNGIAYQSLFFSGPLTTQYAAGEQIEYKTTLNDDWYSPAVDLALFDFTQAQRYCGTLGRMPTSDELMALSTRDVQGTDNWPLTASYLASDDGIAKVINLQTGSADDYYGGAYLVSCVEGGLTVAPDDDVIANGVDQAQVVFSLTGEGQQPMPAGIAIEVTTDSKTAQLETASIMTNDEGRAIARITNTKSESITVCGESGIQKSCTVTSFVGDPASAAVTGISLDVINWTPGSEEIYPIYATVKDEYGNAVKNAYVTFEIIQDTNTAESAQLLSNSSLTDDTGVASVTISNAETFPNDKTEIVAAHTNTAGAASEVSIISNWGSWQWNTPLIVKISDLTSASASTSQVCEPTFGAGYRTLTDSERNEYTRAANNGDLVPESFDTDLEAYRKDPILSKVVEKSQQSDISASVGGTLEGNRAAFPDVWLKADPNYVWKGVSNNTNYDSFTVTYTATDPYYSVTFQESDTNYYFMGTIRNIRSRSKFFTPSFSQVTRPAGKNNLPQYNVICVKPAG